MRLECPICGRLYDYESKICKECEDEARMSQLAQINPSLGEKWNCAIFLDDSNCTFGRRCMDNRPNTSPVELFEFKLGQAPDYNWGIALRVKKEDGLELPDEDLKIVEALKLDELLGFEKKLNLYLVYE